MVTIIVDFYEISNMTVSFVIQIIKKKDEMVLGLCELLCWC